MSIKDEIRIRPISEMVNREYVKPSPGKVEAQISALNSNEDAWNYLVDERGLEPETIKHFKLGFDYERNAISIPIYKDNEVVSIKYRNLSEDGAKYGAEAGCESWLFNEEGLQEASLINEVIVTEGEFDAMCLWQSGIKNVISPAQGKNSYTVWIEKLDKIAKVIIAYDNDKAGKEEAIKFSDRVGIEKSYELVYPGDIKDANEYMKEDGDFSKLVAEAKPFYSYEYSNVFDLVDSIRNHTYEFKKYFCVPGVEFEDDWLTVISGVTNIGKTSYVMNLAKEAVDKGEPVLVLPFERGMRAVGQRYLQLEFEKNKSEIIPFIKENAEKVKDRVKDKPIFFAYPSRDKVLETIEKAVRLFGIQIVIIDHFDYMVRNSGKKNKEQDISDTLYALKDLQMKKKIKVFAVHHIGKQDMKGKLVPPKPHMNDLKGSSSLFQDPEVVIMLYNNSSDELVVDVQKNKGEMWKKDYQMDPGTGKMAEADDF